jgi:hypothetical protein
LESQSGERESAFFIPIIPLLYFYFLQGMNWAIAKLARNRISLGTGIAAVLTVIIALTLLARNIQDWRNPIMNQTTDLSIGASWVAENAATDAIIMVNEPVPAYVHVRRQTIGFPRQGGQDLEKFLINQGIDYIIIAPRLHSPRTTELDEYIEERVLPVINSAPDRFIMVYSNPEHNVTVYQYIGQ